MKSIHLLDSGNFRQQTSEFLRKNSLSGNSGDINYLRRILSGFSLIPYENISKILRYYGNEDSSYSLFRLPDIVWEDYCSESLGGTCFSLTYFLQTILENCGYICYPVTAAMRSGEHVHCALVVRMEGKSWLCDPGYLLNEPIFLECGEKKIYRTDIQGVQIDYQENRYHLSTFHGQQIKWRYSFRDLPLSKEDFIKWWLQSFQEKTMNGICLTRQNSKSMLYVNNNYFREITGSEIRKYRRQKNWLPEIAGYFNISVDLLGEAYEITKQKRSKDETC